MLCRIAHNPPEISWHHETRRNSGFDSQTDVSNSDQLLFRGRAIMMAETSTSSLSFRSSELSQLI
jgi:hypothetical protein